MKTIIFILATSLLLVSVYVFRVDIIQRGAPLVADKFGVNIDEISIEQFDLEKIIVREISFWQKDDYSHLNVDLKNVLIDISVSIQDGVQVSSLVVDDANILLAVGEEEQATSAITVKEYISMLPVFGVDIHNIEVEYHQNQQLFSRFNGVVQSQEGLFVDGLLAYEDFSANVNMRIDDRNAEILLLDVASKDKLLQLDANYHVDDDWLLLKANGVYSLEEALSRFNQKSFSFGAASGEFSVTTEFDLLQTVESFFYKSVADVDFDVVFDLASQQYSIQSAQVNLRAKCLIKELSIDHCVIKQPQSTEFVFDEAPYLITEYLGRDFKKYYLDINPSDVIRLRRTENNKYIVNGDANVFVKTDSSDLKADINVKNIEMGLHDSGWSVLTGYQINVDARKLKYMADAQRALIKFSGSAESDHKNAKIHINDGASVNLFDVEYDDFFAARLEVVQEGAAVVKYDVDSQSARIDKQTLALSSKDMRYQDNELVLDSVTHNLNKYIYSNRGVEMLSDISIEEIQVQKQGFTIKGTDMLANIAVQTDDLHVKGGFLLGSKQAPLNFLLENRLSTGEGSMSFESEKISLFENEVIAQVIGVTGFPLQLKDGGFTLDGDAHWGNDYQDIDMFVHLDASQIDGDYAQNPFENLNVVMKLKGGQGWILAEPSELTIESLNVGIPLNDIRMQIDKYEYGVQQQPAIKMTDFYAGTLEGSVYSDVLDIDLNKEINEFSIFLSSLSLEKLVELNQTQDLIATGLVNGELPMKLNQGVLEIDSGWMKASEQGGVIQYGRVKDVLQGNKDLALVAELLQDFQYSEMSAMVNLNPDGALRLETKLHGRSPDAQFNTPINMNFNIDLNLWKFLESARLLTRIGQDITDQVTTSDK